MWPFPFFGLPFLLPFPYSVLFCLRFRKGLYVALLFLSCSSLSVLFSCILFIILYLSLINLHSHLIFNWSFSVPQSSRKTQKNPDSLFLEPAFPYCCLPPAFHLSLHVCGVPLLQRPERPSTVQISLVMLKWSGSLDALLIQFNLSQLQCC